MMQDFMWVKLQELAGIDRRNPSTWMRPWKGLKRSRRAKVYRAIATPRLRGAIDQLLGPRNWKLPKHWGGFLITFPRLITGAEDAIEEWHLDFPVLAHLVGLRALFVFTLYSRISSGGGGTLFLAGSHHLVRQFYSCIDDAKSEHRLDAEGVPHLSRKEIAAFDQAHPWMQAMAFDSINAREQLGRFMVSPQTIEGVPIQVAEVTGEPGDAFLAHPLLYHSRSVNNSSVPRFMRAKMVSAQDPGSVPSDESEGDDWQVS